jgi:protein-tyrosine phosphatase
MRRVNIHEAKAHLSRLVERAAARRPVAFMDCSRNDPRHFRATKMKIVLFLCTGNYYRSRFAEEMFNSSAPVECPGWRAISRGLAVDLGVNNVGPIAKSAVHALRSSGVDFNWKLARMPLQLETVDLETADHIVALKKAEHLPLLRERFHSWLGANEPDRVEYWHIDDVDQMVPARALPLILDELQVLKTRLSRDPVGDMKL